MPNKRFQFTQEDGERTRIRRKNLKVYPMSPQEAATLICEAHTRTVNDEHGFMVDWGASPDFSKIDGDLYWKAWRVMRQYAAGEEDSTKRR